MKLYAFFAEGYEEIEALTVVDIIRRAGMEAVMVSVTGDKKVRSSHGVDVITDELVENLDFSQADVLFLPGGMPGTRNLMKCRLLMDKIMEHNEAGKRLAAVCAAPSVFGHLGLLAGRKATCFPGFEEELTGAEVVGDAVVTDGNITTSRGMGTTIQLGLEIVRLFKGEEESVELGKKIQYL